MKRGTGIGTIVVIGLIIWWLTRNRQAQAAATPAGEMSEYERLHTYVPITANTEKLLRVYVPYYEGKGDFAPHGDLGMLAFG